MFITLFTYWNGADYACMAAAVLLAYGVLSVGCKLFQKKDWPWQQPSVALRMLLPAIVMVAPLAFYLHTLKAEALADGESGQALLRELYVNRDSASKLLAFFEKYSQTCEQKDEFMQSAIPAYAQYVVKAHQERFLPLSSWPSVDAGACNPDASSALSDVWHYRGSADLQHHSKHVYSVLNAAAREYLVAEQQKQNMDALQRGYSVHLWFMLTTILAFYLASTWVSQSEESDGGDVKHVQ